ncbi:TPR domain protein [Pochonia chlamydosporia 170]|uniref:TPR domain protein n=1 Tax=Pochonia chlamydosporia 170 TaxID=1380566 RepID=A0A179EWG5_METCM|nr:TPR domain protein [Pochonia chlamydosporia 170]XP_022283883.1 TPR domain-containing protein [Pochonia chlamydosporia 170]OAQ57511.1 TPR domain-containing protein [Pochonia chlamydosporia 170]OWT42654.1 TPR domain protein [Pochonia chlamydosporia 170]
MTSHSLPAEHIYCVQAGKKHHDLFTTIYSGENYCGQCGLANPFSSQSQARSRTPARPSPHNEVVKLEDSPPRPVSPASQLLRDRTKSSSSANVGHAQLLPNTVSVLNGADTQARLHAPRQPPFGAVASAASQAIQNSKASTRKPTRQRTGYQWVHISLLLVSLEARYFNGLVVEVPKTVLPLKDTVIKFNSVDLLTWPSFTKTLFEHLRPLPSSINASNKRLWNLSFASAFSGKKIVTVSNTDKYITPSSMLSSGHFSSNQAGQLKVLVVLTSTQVINRQEPITPLRPDKYSTPPKENRKRRIKEEDKTPSLVHKKRIKQEKDIERGNKTKREEIKQEIHVKTEQYDPDTNTSSPGLTCNKLDMEELGEMEHSLSNLVSNSIDNGIRDKNDTEQEAGQEGENKDETKNAMEFVGLSSAGIHESAGGAQVDSTGSMPVKELQHAHSTRFRGTKTPATFASQHRKQKD